MSYLMEVLGRGLLTELAAAFREVLVDDCGDSTRALRDATRNPIAEADDYARLARRLLQNRDVVGAKVMFTNAVRIHPDDTRSRLGLACALDELGRTEEALAHLLQAVCDAPDDPALRFSIGYCRERMGDFDEALQSYDKALRICKGLRNAHERMAAIYVRREMTDRAIYHYEQLCAMEPDDVPMTLSLANLYFRAKRYDDAAYRYRFALTIDPDNWEANDDLVATFESAGRFDEAIEHMLDVIDREPSFPDNHLRLGDLYAKCGREEQALEQYLEAVDLSPGYLEALIKIGSLHLRQNEHNEACRWFNRAIDVNDHLLNAYVGLAVTQHEQGLLDDAMETLDLAAKIEPNSALLFSETAKLQLRVRADQQAEQYLADITPSTSAGAASTRVNALLDEQIERHTDVLKNRPNYADLHYHLGLLYRQRGSREAAVTCFRNALDINPKYINAAVKLGLALQADGDYQAAVNTLRSAMTDTDRDAALHHELGLIFADRNKFALALEQYETAIAKDPRNIDLHANLALALQNMGLIDKAAARWEALAEIADQSEEFRSLPLPKRPQSDL